MEHRIRHTVLSPALDAATFPRHIGAVRNGRSRASRRIPKIKNNETNPIAYSYLNLRGFFRIWRVPALAAKWLFGLVLVLALGGAAIPARADDLATLRQEMEQMRQQYDAALKNLQKQYETRLKTMENRVEAAEHQAAAATAAAASATAAANTATTAATTAAAAPAAAPAPAPATEAAPASAAAFNPAIGAVLDGKFTASNHNPNTYRVPGIPLGDEGGPPPRGFGIGESEINAQANVDQALFANLTISFQRDNVPSVEEAFIQPTALPYGFTVKAGRFFSGIGYLNEQHSHTWDFADQALPYRAFLNGQYDDDGIQLRWLAPTDMFLEFGGEAARGDSFPAGGDQNHNDGVGAWSAFVHAGDDIGTSASYSVGLSQLWTSAKNRSTTGLFGNDNFSGTDRTFIADGVYKWAPNGNFALTYLKLQSEFFLRQEQGVFTPAGTVTGLRYSSSPQTGFYAQAIYQFMPQWRVGIRYDQVHAPDLGPLFAGTTLDSLDATARRYSAMVDYSTSEFGRFRVQYNLDRSRPETDNQLILQYIVSIGAHGAHQY
jgi:hypothetical protein